MKVSAAIISISLALFQCCGGCSREQPPPLREQGYKVVMPIKRPASEKAATSLTATSLAQGQQVCFKEWIESLRKEALSRHISEKTLNAAFTDLKPIPEIISLDRAQPEFKQALQEYLHRVVSESRITEGRKKLEENRTLLKRVASYYGLEPRFLVALWGIETDFGSFTGSFSVIGSLVTLAYDGRRSSYFQKELIHALRILDEGHMSIAQMKGSWAGAMGQLQFMPSTFRCFAVDYNGDGHIDIWKDRGDVFASAANYLMQSGWKKGQTWGQEVRLPNNLDQALIAIESPKPLNQWQALGVRCLDGQDFPTKDLASAIVRPDGPTGRAFLVYSNYRCILKWNPSHNFAIAVGILSDQIANPKNISTSVL